MTSYRQDHLSLHHIDRRNKDRLEALWVVPKAGDHLELLRKIMTKTLEDHPIWTEGETDDGWQTTLTTFFGDCGKAVIEAEQSDQDFKVISCADRRAVQDQATILTETDASRHIVWPERGFDPSAKSIEVDTSTITEALSATPRTEIKTQDLPVSEVSKALAAMNLE